MRATRLAIAAAIAAVCFGPQALARPSITVQDKRDDGRPGLVVVETKIYRIAFDRVKQGRATTAMHKQ